jgi:outer membrane protein OmpA-like peptidoglycan-associated protein
MKMKLYARLLAPLAVAFLLTPMLSLHAQSTGGSSGSGIEFPKAELFLGYSHFGTSSNNTTIGNRMVGLNGGSASIAFNFNRYIGLVADIGVYANSQLQLTGSGANEPLVVNANGTAYTFLLGPRLSFRNSTRLTPFAQVLVGGVHASNVTISGCTGSACTPLPAQLAFAMTGGGGLDIRLTQHFSLRPIQAEYMMTRFADVAYGSTGAATTENDLRLSSGLLFGFGGKPPLPVQLTCSVQPGSAFPGDPMTVTAVATNLNPKHPASYSWSTNGGTVSGSDTTATIGTVNLAPGTYAVTGHVSQGKHVYEEASCTASFTIKAFEPPTITCSANPDSVNPGDPSTITAQGVSPQNRPLTYSYAATAGTVTGNTTTATLNTASVPSGPITVTCSAVDDLGKSASANTTVTVNAPPPPPVAAPQTRDLCAVSFDRDHKRPERVDNEAKGCLDDIALDMQRETTGRLVVVGNYSSDEQPEAGARRALNLRQYLVNEKGVESSRIDLRIGTNSGRTATDVFVPAGATYVDTGTTPLDPTIDYRGERNLKPHHKPHHPAQVQNQ